jgi:hypothetical protein
LDTGEVLVKQFSVLFKRRGQPFSKGENTEIIAKEYKYTENLEKNLQTRRPNSINLSRNYPWVKGIQVCSNKGPGPLQRGDNHKNVK